CRHYEKRYVFNVNVVNSIKPLGYNSREAFLFRSSRKKNMDNRRIFLIALISLMAITACVVPGLPTASAPLPTLTVDTGRIAMMVAGTVSAVVAQTGQAQPASTPIPTATSTFTPTPASTSVPLPTATPTSQSSPSQSTLSKQEDGSLLFSDEFAYYKIKLPAGWLTVRINEKEYLDAFSLAEAANTHVQQSLLGVQNEDPNVFRLLAIDTQAAHIQNEFVTDMRFVLDEEMDISLNSDEDLQAIAQEIPASAAVFRFEVTSVKIFTSASGIDFGVIEARSSFTNAVGIDVAIYQKQVFFNVPVGTQSITLTTVADLKDTLLPAFDAMFETVEIIEEE
ncbi:MAG: hypothetical protein J0653_04865, partial [Deltaproteobacteria bacterium]|nr:hypothetical protein [Deltaproteobacteria bacterium]